MDVNNLSKEMLLEFAETEQGKLALKTKTTKCIKPYPIELFQAAKNFVSLKENGALGLAAPQINRLDSWFVMKLQRTGEVITIINPIVLGKQGHKQYVEGCFSEKLPANIKRPKSVTVKFDTEQEENILRVFEGRDAQVFMHEFEHLQGMLLSTKGVVC